MKNRRTIWFLLFTLLLSALACNLPQAAISPPGEPTDSGFQVPAQPGVQETSAPGATPLLQTTSQPAAPAGAGTGANENKLTLGTTSSLVDSGLLDALLNQFRTSADYRIVVEAGGAGRALRLGEKSVADVLLINEPGSEKKFIEEGFGKDRLPVMYADYVIVGPATDPAGVKGATNAAQALQKIAGAQARFIAPADGMSTKGAETKLWKTAGITPQGGWYTVTDQGPVGTLKLASDASGYAITERATFLENQDKFNLEILYEGDELLRDYYHVLTVNPDRSPKINYPAALALAQFLTSAEAQAIIQQFGVDTLGQPIFFPAAQP
jgi:tungstate transport system substrate-binding protein